MNKNTNHKQSFRNALAGLREALNTERNFRMMLFLSFGVVLIGFWLGVSLIEAAILVWACFAVMAVEMINTSLESITDLVKEEWHQKAGRAKDVAAGMVLLASFGAALVGLMILGPKLVSFLLG